MNPRSNRALAKPFLIGTFLIAAVLATAPTTVLAGSANAADPTPPTAWYWHNWTDHNGVSHMTHCPFHNYDLKTMSKPAGPQWQDLVREGQARIISTVQPPHWDGSWHPDPKVQWIIPLQGSWYVTAMDGRKVVMGPGDVSVGEDQLSRKDAQGHVGHFAGNIGDGAVTLMVIQTDETPTVDQPCRFH